MTNNERIVYIAFPGMGKTTYAQNHPGVLDLDFGFYRSSIWWRGNTKLGINWIYSAFRKFCTDYAKQGWKILTNEPALIPLLKQSGFTVIVEVPSDVDDLVHRVVARDGANDAFAQALRSNASAWVQDWIKTAEKYQLQLVTAKYFKEVEMPYEQRK